MSSVKSSYDYFASWSATLLAKADLVRNLIGDVHWLSDGNHKEQLIREFLVEYLPIESRISSGFIKPPRADVRCSRELDVIIYDTSRHTPYFCQGGLSIIPPAAAIAHVEAKSSFTKSVLCKALSNVKTSKELVERFGADQGLFWAAICFFYSPEEKSLQQIGDTILDSIEENVRCNQRDLAGSTNAESSGNYVNLLPNFIFSIDGFVAFPILSSDKKKIEIHVYRSLKLSTAVVFSSLLSHIRSWYGGAVVADIHSELLDLFDTSLEHHICCCELG